MNGLYIVQDFMLFLDVQANLPETSPFINGSAKQLPSSVCSAWDV
jgi:hypothetical protein